MGFKHNRVDPLDSLVFSFRIRHGFTPSTANNWQLAFGADFSENPMGIGKGIVVGVNFTGSDDLVKIWELTESGIEELCVSTLNYQEEVGIESAPLFKMLWSPGPESKLSLFFAKDPSIEDLELIGSCRMDHLPPGQHLIVRYAYSPARDRGLWLDELLLSGRFIRDTLAPYVTEVRVRGEKGLQLTFSEPVVLPTGNAFLLEGEAPDSCHLAGNEVVLDFTDPFPNHSEQALWMANICDREQNCLLDTVVHFMRNEAEWGDVVINEVMADPAPAILLPEEEYLELYNRSDYTCDLALWRLEVDQRVFGKLDFYKWSPTGPIPASSLLGPDSYLLIKGVSLPNEGAILALYNQQGSLIHGVSYQLPWEGADWKKEGGWSLESPDPEKVCKVSEWWEYASDPSGGTPGRVNSRASIREDEEAPVMLYYGYESAGKLALTYSETVRFSPVSPLDFLLRPGSILPTGLSWKGPLGNCLVLEFPTDFRERGQFTVDLPAVMDCQDNLSQPGRLPGGKVTLPQTGKLFINEIMFNPLDGYPEFVELYNPGPDFFDLRYLSIHLVETGDLPHRPFALSEESRIFIPGQYLVISSCVPQLMEAYDLDRSGSWLEVAAWPLMKNTGGTLYLTDRSGGVVDQVNFSEDMHMELLTDTKGISLERISIQQPGIHKGNWHSAASLAGYATPGEENSQAGDLSLVEDYLKVEPAVFSPDNDGYQDLLTITLSTPSHGWVIRLWVSDLRGKLVKDLASNHIAGPAMTYRWDGENEQGHMTAEGIYVIHLLSYHPVSGEQRSRKAAIGLIYR